MTPRPLIALLATALAAAAPLAPFASNTAHAQTPTAPAAAAPVKLPRNHDDQKALIAWIGSLKPEDMNVEIKPFIMDGPDSPKRSPADLHKLWALTVDTYLTPTFDLGATGDQFTLAKIETDQGVFLPNPTGYGGAWLANWNDPMNPYYGNLALKRRAVVWAAVDMMMLEQYHDNRKGMRSDFLGGTLIWLGYTYLTCKDVMTPAAQEAYATGLRRLVERNLKWGPTGAMTDMDLFAPVGLYYSAQALNDPALMKAAEDYSRPLFEHPRFYHPAGYFVDVGAYDVSYNGISLFFAAHAAVLTNWDFINKALDKAYDLRRYMVFPDPAGRSWGPVHYSPRTADCAASEQWQRPIRDVAAAMVGDSALPLVPNLTDEDLAKVPKTLHGMLQQRNGGAPTSAAWTERHWSSSIPFAYEYYKPDLRQRRAAYEKSHPDQIPKPFERPGTFIRNFADVLLSAKQPTYGVILHTGPIGNQNPDNLWGFSGGALSGFWTPKTGPVILGRRSGSQGGAIPDSFDNWTLWPVHGTSGITTDGGVFTTARVKKPQAQYQTTNDRATVTANGTIKTGDGADTRNGGALKNPIDYTRTFNVNPDAITIQTTLKSTDPLPVKQLYEMFPLFHGATNEPDKTPLKKIQAQINGQWTDLTPAAVTTNKIRVERANGAILIELDKPRPVKLSTQNWEGKYQSRSSCRNLLVSHLETDDKPGTLTQSTIQYRILAEP